MKSYMAKGETVERSWYVVDAQDMVLGRLSSQVAAILRGKHKPIYTPLGDKMLTKVRIYAGPEHKNAAQMPQPLKLK